MPKINNKTRVYNSKHISYDKSLRDCNSKYLFQDLISLVCEVDNWERANGAKNKTR